MNELNREIVLNDLLNALKAEGKIRDIEKDYETKEDYVEIDGQIYSFFITIEITERPYVAYYRSAVLWPVDQASPAESEIGGEFKFYITKIICYDENNEEYDLSDILTPEDISTIEKNMKFDEDEFIEDDDELYESKKIQITEQDILYMVKSAVMLLKEQYESRERPAVYVGTYGKYNSGSLQGEWVNLDDFDSKEEFLTYCIQTLHANERDPELMFQDWEYIPDGFIGESYISDQLWDFINLQEDYSIKYAIAQHCGDVKEAMNILDNQDYSVHYGCDNVEDVVYQYLDELGPEGFNNLDMYFDYERFGRECSWDGPFDDSGEYESIYQEFGVDEDDDEALGEEIIDQLYGGIENTPKETVQQYVNTKMLAQALENNRTFIEVDTNNGSAVIELY